MRKFKKFAAMVSAVTLAACAVAPVFSFADEPSDGGQQTETSTSVELEAGKVKFTGETAGTHSYSAYKIFAGDAAANGMSPATGAKLDNLSWVITDEQQKALVTALKADDRFKTDEINDFASFADDSVPAVADFAAILAGYSENHDKAKAFAETVVKLSLSTT